MECRIDCDPEELHLPSGTHCSRQIQDRLRVAGPSPAEEDASLSRDQQITARQPVEGGWLRHATDDRLIREPRGDREFRPRVRWPEETGEDDDGDAGKRYAADHDSKHSST